jgi:hypothetical protein
MITHDEDDLMPPAESGKKISEKQIALLKTWIKQGAPYAKHWSYVKPKLPQIPEVNLESWVKNPIDQFILAKLEENSLKPSPAADRRTLIRRLALDLTGLPPTLKEVDTFLNDKSPKAVENLVDHLMAKNTFGEHWASRWLDLARYADSAGYADDRKRTIWAYRDYVIRSFNENKPFDQFTREQLAGDLLKNPSEQQLIATAFHRNTQTNSEGGTVDEEFRNAAVVDRVNTTLAVWMGTTMGCAQCHTHKYDPITHEEYFQVFSILNNTVDADRPDEAPILDIWTQEQKNKKAQLTSSIESLKKELITPTSETKASQKVWEEKILKDVSWSKLNSKTIEQQPTSTTYSFDIHTKEISGLKLSFPASKNNKSQLHLVEAELIPRDKPSHTVQYLRISIPGNNKILSLAEVQVFSQGKNIAPQGQAKQSSHVSGGIAKRAIDNKTDGAFSKNSVTHTKTEKNPWWELNLKSAQSISDIVIWNRTDGDVYKRLNGAVVELLDQNKKVVWKTTLAKAPKVKQSIFRTGLDIKYARNNLGNGAKDLNSLLKHNPKNNSFEIGLKKQELYLALKEKVSSSIYSTLNLTIQHSAIPTKEPFAIQVSTSHDDNLIHKASLPVAILNTINKNTVQRTQQEKNQLELHYIQHLAPELESTRKSLATSEKQLTNMKPTTTVPIFRQLPKNKERVTKVQLRGNYLVTGKVVKPGVTKAIHPYKDEHKMTRLDLANWLMDPDNPLTARVTVNRYWEKIFGMGIVSTSDEFGSQGELPSHPELLDWLAIQLIDMNWDIKQLLKLIVTSSTYQQSSKVSPELQEIDPVNTLLSRAPRVRLSAEMVRDQALASSGLLSTKLYGPPVNPPQPSMGLNAAFGKTLDWKTSEGEDRYRRSLYTEWRRSNPYPSMVTFDAPNREVCVVKRDSSNTPLQALVTMNDPVYIEAAQALARRGLEVSESEKEQVAQCFKICLTREPMPKELESLHRLYRDTYKMYQQNPIEAHKMATDPLGPLSEGQDAVKLAAMTVVSNIIMNLDEMFIKR